MQLGEWRKTAPNRDCMSNAVLNALKPVLSDLGAPADPECWVEWGDDPEFRYSVMVPTRAGLISAAVRLNAGSEPRVTGKLIRWTRLQASELSVESSGGHRIVAVQVEGQVLKGTDADADRVCEFVRGLVAAMDGRDWQFSTDGLAPLAFAASPQKAAPTRAATAKQAPKAAAKPTPKAATKGKRAEPEEDQAEDPSDLFRRFFGGQGGVRLADRAREFEMARERYAGLERGRKGPVLHALAGEAGV